MRLRNVKKAYARFEDFEKVIREPEAYKGKWYEFFGNDNPIHIEIGMGKGDFLMGMAKRNPEINYIGFEKITVVATRALNKIEKEEDLDNLYVVRFDAEHILNMFEENEVERIYLNFSDPWPKERHYKRRLTYRDFLEKYRYILKSDGVLRFKTDNVGLFDYSLKEMSVANMAIIEVTRDLHNSPYVEGNIMTEYEKKFTNEGIPINMVMARF